MIASLTGRILVKSPTGVVLDVQGVGYEVHIPLSTYAAIGDVGSTVTLLTHLQVREDAMSLFGFATADERGLFRLLLSVTGIGPKLAQNILSGIPASDLRSLIRTGQAAALTGIPGIGRKTAERIILDLRDKVTDTPAAPEVAGATAPDVRAEALQALLALGFPRTSAEKSVHAALQAADGAALPVEELVKRALKLSGLR